LPTVSHQNPQDDGGLSYPYAVTMNEVLEIVVEHIDKVQNTSDLLRQGVHLKMASRALRCALEIYGSQITKDGK
jgi:hypothetical protein